VSKKGSETEVGIALFVFGLALLSSVIISSYDFSSGQQRALRTAAILTAFWIFANNV
jgi:hypothetical protein